ncbi:hypothetical protein RAD15_43070 [Bradyrhizobium sp. 14AA]
MTCSGVSLSGLRSVRNLIANGQASWNDETPDGDPCSGLRELLAKHPQGPRPDLPPFEAGAAGFLAYGLNKTQERLQVPASLGRRLPDSILHFYGVGSVLDLVHRMA